MTAKATQPDNHLITDSKWLELTRLLKIKPPSDELRSDLEIATVNYLRPPDHRRSANIRRRLKKVGGYVTRLRTNLAALQERDHPECELTEIFLSGLHYPRVQLAVLIKGLAAVENNGRQSALGLSKNGSPGNHRLAELIRDVDGILSNHEIHTSARRSATIVEYLSLLLLHSQSPQLKSLETRVRETRARSKLSH